MRTYKRHTDRGMFKRDTMMSAVTAVVDNGESIRQAAKNYGVNYKTLGRYVKTKTQTGTLANASFGYSTPRKVFEEHMEQILVDYAILASQIYHGLTIYELRKLAFNFAVSNKVDMPKTWKEKEIAGQDWGLAFMKRHKAVLSLRTPEATSLQRMACFNEINVQHFYDNLQLVMDKGFTADRIYNCDETGVTTVQRPTKQIAKKGEKRVGAIVSQERGVLVTICAAVNAIGNSIPPFLVFPRVKTQEIWRTMLPTGSVAEGHPKASGWMTTENFLSFLKHFIQHARPSSETPILLLLDNHQSHISIDAIHLCKENNITLLSFPPHCSHELQPLDKTVFGPFKTFINQAADNWMRDPYNAGKPMTIHTIPVLVKYAFDKAFTPTNIRSGFQSTGIYPFDRHVIPQERYLPSFTTDRPCPSKESSLTKPSQSNTTTNSLSTLGTITSTSGIITSPHAIRPLGKAPPRKPGQKRKKGTSLVYTSTPVKKALDDDLVFKQSGSGKHINLRKRSFTTEAENESHTDIDQSDSSLDESVDDILENEEPFIETPNITQLSAENFVLVRFATKKTFRYFIGKIESLDPSDNTIEVQFMKRKPTKTDTLIFVFPDHEDAGEVHMSDVIILLPKPATGGTVRSGTIYTFSCEKLKSYVIE